MENKVKITIITATLNEICNIELLINSLSEIAKYNKYNLEHIIVDNGSTDGTVEVIEKNLNRGDISVKLIKNLKNNGPDFSTWVGLHKAQGDIIIVLVADFQDPIELIPLMIEKLNNYNSFDSVICCNNEKIYTVRNIINNFFYYFLNFVSLSKEYKGFQGYCALKKGLVSRMLRNEFKYYYFRGLVNKTTINPIILKYKKNKRKFGKSNYNFYKLIRHSIVAVNSQNKYLIPITFLMLFSIFENKIFLLILLLMFVYQIQIYSSET